MKKVIYLILGLAVLFVGWYLLSPLFIQTEIQEELPDFAQEVIPPVEPEEVEEVATSTEEVVVEPQSTSEGPFPVIDTPGHAASGDAYVLSDGAQTVIRYEDFSTINGPNLHVYLATDLDATEYIDLGPIKATSGDINYEVPAGTDLDMYRYVLTWCVPFRVLFNSAELAHN